MLIRLTSIIKNESHTVGYGFEVIKGRQDSSWRYIESSKGRVFLLSKFDFEIFLFAGNVCCDSLGRRVIFKRSAGAFNRAEVIAIDPVDKRPKRLVGDVINILDLPEDVARYLKYRPPESKYRFNLQYR